MKGWLTIRNIVTEQKFKELDYSSFLAIKEVLNKVEGLEITIIGTSMIPFYKNSGQKVSVKPLKSLDALKRFDIIVFWQQNILVAHYYWKQNSYFNENEKDPNLMTRPLNPIKAFDHPIKFEHILGKIDDELPWWLRIKILINILFK